MNKFLLAVFAFISIVSPVFAIDMSREIDAAAAKVMPKVVEWRRFLHQHPELSNREVNTAKFVADELRKLGIEVRTGIAKTGVVGILKGAGAGPVIGLRADMDALPVTERNSLPFASKETAEFNGQKGRRDACVRP
jgi:amidohydrolase